MNLPAPTRQERRALEAENRRWPAQLRQVHRSDWPPFDLLPRERQPFEVWRSSGFLVQLFPERDGIERITVCRTTHTGESFEDNITWDDLQRLKSECGRGEKDAIEIFPADRDVVNIANMRHLWVLPHALPLVWRPVR